MKSSKLFIRNFCIIAHIDHGKSTLADRMLEITKTIPENKMQDQILDRNPIERERGISIKLQPVRMRYSVPDSGKQTDGGRHFSSSKLKPQEYILNLIDTPGHVDFSYEVSRSLACVEGAVLLVDASQGVQAQTLSNLKLAQKLGLKIIPVVNKIDLRHSAPERTALEIVDLFGCKEEEVLFTSGKTGEGVDEVLENIITKLPPPNGELKAPFRGLIFDSVYDEHRGVVVFVRIVDGKIKCGETIELLGGGAVGKVLEVGYFTPEQTPREDLSAGEIGYIVTSFKDIRKVRVGDTITVGFLKDKKTGEGLVKKNILPLVRYSPPKPMVYASVFPLSPADYPLLSKAIEKYALTDASLNVEPENSPIFGFGYRLGFLGLLHIEIVSERLRREYGLELIVTTPHVEYKVVQNNGKELSLHSVLELPDSSKIAAIKEPWVELELLSPTKYLGKLMELAKTHRASDFDLRYLEKDAVILKCKAPLSEIIVNFYDELKSATSGYASMNYRQIGFKRGELVKMDILLAGEKNDAFSQIVPLIKAEKIAREKIKKLKVVIPRQQFEIRVQAVVGGRVVASEKIPPLRKNVTEKLYGGDVSRKKKLLKKQAEGKKRLRRFGKVELPPETFIELFKK